MPFAFTEQGIYMLATVLHGELAEQQSIFIMRTFRKMRHYIKQNLRISLILIIYTSVAESVFSSKFRYKMIYANACDRKQR